MQLLRTTVRRNWQEITQSTLSENMTLWRSVQVATMLSVLGVLLINVARLPRPWQDFLRLGVSSSIFCILPLRYVYKHHRHAKRLTLLIFVLFVANAAIIAITRPAFAPEVSTKAISPWPVGLSLLAVLISWIVLFLMYRAFPTRMQKLGIASRAWTLNLLLGAMVAGIAGFHLLLSTDFLVAGRGIRLPNWPILLWTFCYYAGLQAVGEEIFFRGLGLYVLSEGLYHSQWKAVLRVTFLNLLVYLVWIPPSQYTTIWFWLVAYRSGLVLVNAFLRYRQKSILPGLAANIIFNLFVVGFGL